IIRRYNFTYLQTELLTLEAVANSAGQWRDFVDRSDLYPNLKYVTAGDERVRDSHAAIDGAIYPVGDPFWDTHTPPIDWRCRCILVQTDEDTVVKTGVTPRAGFGRNPAKTKALIQRDHPYFNLPVEELNNLFLLAEEMRARIELSGNKRRAGKASNRKATFQAGEQLDMTKDAMTALMRSKTGSKGTRDALLANLSLAITQNLTQTFTSAERRVYVLSFLDLQFEIEISIGDKVTITKFSQI
ncbi:MAG: phage minor head protein, partial [Bacteroidota bacterium]